MQNILLILIIVILFNCCSKDINIENVSAKAIVESYLLAGQPIKVHISKEILFSSTSDTVETLNNLVVKIIYNDSVFILTPIGNGDYCSDSTLIAKEGGFYSLEFEYENDLITASTYIPTKPQSFNSSATSLTIEQYDLNNHMMPSMPDPIELTWSNPYNDYFLIVVENIETSLVPVRDIENDQDEDKRPRFRNQPNQSEFYNLDFRNFSYYGKHNIILFKLNTEYSTLYEETGSNSQNLITPLSNIKNGLGIFTGINSDTLTLIIKQ